MTAPAGAVTSTAVRGTGRSENPFAVQHTEPGAIPFLGRGEACLDAILVRLIALGLRGQITGAHGSGKTTLLIHLAGRARALGWGVAMARAGREPIRMPPRGESRERPRVLLLDSAEQLSAWKWSLIRRAAEARGVGLVVTTHRDLGLPQLHHREVQPSLAHELISRLAAPLAAPIPDADELGVLLAARSGSMRDVLFEMYDRYESR